MTIERDGGSDDAAEQGQSSQIVSKSVQSQERAGTFLPRCPDFALEDDPKTSLLFPSVEGLCYRALPPATPRLAHQRTYCLRPQHIGCPVFRRQERGPLLDELVEPTVEKSTYGLNLSPPVGPLLLLAIIVLLLGFGSTQMANYVSNAPAQASSTPLLDALVTPPGSSEIQFQGSAARNRLPAAAPTTQSVPTASNTALPPATVTPLAPPAEALATPIPSPTPSPSPTDLPTSPPTPVPRAVVLVDFLNIRTGPGLNYPILALATLNSQYDVVGRLADNSWWQVCCTEDNVGWMFGEAVAIDGNFESLPIITDIPVPPAAEP